jgi:hypothetical protein
MAKVARRVGGVMGEVIDDPESKSVPSSQFVDL